MAKSITIHGLDESVAKLIEAKAKSDGRSLNKTIHSLLEHALNVQSSGDSSRKEIFREFLGVWKKSDLAEFNRFTEGLRIIDEGDWR